MTLDEALALQDGDWIASPHDSPPYRVRRITPAKELADGTPNCRGVFVAPDRSYVRVSLASFRGGEWIDPRGFMVVPKKATDFDPQARRFFRIHKGERVFVGNPIP